jgi:hypothetical protein
MIYHILLTIGNISLVTHGWSHSDYSPPVSLSILWANDIRIGYSIPDHSIWKRMPWGEAEMHSFSYTNDQVLYNQFSPYFLCRVSWLPIITNLDSLSQIRLNEYQLKSISFNYNICGIWKIFNNTRQRKYGLTHFSPYFLCLVLLNKKISLVTHGWSHSDYSLLISLSILWANIRT